MGKGDGKYGRPDEERIRLSHKLLAIMRNVAPEQTPGSLRLGRCVKYGISLGLILENRIEYGLR